MFGFEGDAGEGGEELAVFARRGRLDDGDRRGADQATGFEAARDRLEVFHAHIKTERGPETRVVFPTNRGVGLRRVFVAGEENDATGVRAVRERDARVGRRGQRRGDARNNLKRDARRDERLGFLAPAAEDKWIAAFESHDGFPFAREPHEDGLDIALGAAEAAAFFADEDFFGMVGGQRQNRGRDQIIIDHRVGLADEPMGFEREQLGVAWTGADESDTTGRIKGGG